MYKKQKPLEEFGKVIESKTIIRIADNAYIPQDPANTDYQQFKKDIMAGGELQDADGVVMSADAAKEFVAKLP